MLKKPDLTNSVFKLYPYKSILVQRGLCTHCSKPIDETTFRTNDAKLEYSSSGICQMCQDTIFKLNAFGD